MYTQVEAIYATKPLGVEKIAVFCQYRINLCIHLPIFEDRFFVLSTVSTFILTLIWDPSREMFSFNIPFLNRPILWYGFFFGLAFLLGYRILIGVIKKTPELNPLEAKPIAEK